MWVASDRFKATRLLGKAPLDAIDDRQVALIFLASSVLAPSPEPGAKAPKGFNDLGSELWSATDEDKVFFRELEKRPLARLKPKSADEAREELRRLVEQERERLLLLRAENERLAADAATRAVDRLAFDLSPEGEKIRRYALSTARLVNQTLNTFIRVRDGLVAEAETDSSAAPVPQAFGTRPSEASAYLPAVPSPLAVATESTVGDCNLSAVPSPLAAGTELGEATAVRPAVPSPSAAGVESSEANAGLPPVPGQLAFERGDTDGSPPTGVDDGTRPALGATILVLAEELNPAAELPEASHHSPLTIKDPPNRQTHHSPPEESIEPILRTEPNPGRSVERGPKSDTYRLPEAATRPAPITGTGPTPPDRLRSKPNGPPWPTQTEGNCLPVTLEQANGVIASESRSGPSW
jgi:hypothetical protein